METGLSELKELFELKDRDLRTYSPLTLAHIGDGVYGRPTLRSSGGSIRPSRR